MFLVTIEYAQIAERTNPAPFPVLILDNCEAFDGEFTMASSSSELIVALGRHLDVYKFAFNDVW